MNKRYVALSVVAGRVVNDEPVPLEVAVLVLDDQMRPLDNYSTPIIPTDVYDLSMISMHTPAHLTNALEDEGLWAQLQVNALPAESADRYISDKIERTCIQGEHEVIVLCDHTASTQAHTHRFLPHTTKKLSRRSATWLEVAPLKTFAEQERVYGRVEWKARAAARAHSIANYYYQMLVTAKAGAEARTRQA